VLLGTLEHLNWIQQQHKSKQQSSTNDYYIRNKIPFSLKTVAIAEQCFALHTPEAHEIKIRDGKFNMFNI